MIKMTYEELEGYSFSSEYDDALCIVYEGDEYYFHLKYNEAFSKLICFSNGAIDPSKKKPPLYQRNSWRNDFKASCLFIDDPTLHNANLKIGWGQGREDNFALEKIAVILTRFLKKLNYSEEKTTFYGSSAGGYMSMYLGTLIKGTKVIVNNPQTNVLNYIENSVNQMLDIVYSGLSKEEVINKYLYRLSITHAFKHHNYLPNILYLQNLASAIDMKDHVKPFKDNLSTIDNAENKVEYYFYKHPKEGHSPLPKDQTIRLIMKNI